MVGETNVQGVQREEWSLSRMLGCSGIAMRRLGFYEDSWRHITMMVGRSGVRPGQYLLAPKGRRLVRPVQTVSTLGATRQ